MSRVMIIVSTPADSAETLRKAIGEAGGGKLGDYSFCSFSYTGKARFLPNYNADPAIGDSGQLEVVEEEPVIAAYAMLDLG